MLALRERVEEERLAIFAGHQAQFRAASAILTKLRTDLRRTVRALVQNRSSRPENLRLLYAQINFLDGSIARYESLVAASRARCEDARSNLAEATKERKAMQILKERQLSEHLQSAQRRERHELEESNARRFAGVETERRAARR